MPFEFLLSSEVERVAPLIDARMREETDDGMLRGPRSDRDGSHDG